MEATRTFAPRLGNIGIAGVAAFVAVCATVQFLRADLDWQRATLSFYLLGEYGTWVQVAYFALAATLVSLGVGFHRALQPHARSAAPLLLFALAALALCITAVADSNLPQRAESLEGFVHGTAAQTAFLCVTTAMLLQSWRLRGDTDWRGRFALAFMLALACFIAMWVHALWRDAPRGLTQKAVIVLIAIWLGMAAIWLRRQERPAVDAAAGLPG
jgi:hypothetical protein